MALNAGELLTILYLHGAHNISFEKLVFVKSLKIQKTVKKIKHFRFRGPLFYAKSLDVAASGVELSKSALFIEQSISDLVG